MRRLALVLLLAACAHAPRSRDPRNWVELESEHFVLRTDLSPGEAREAMADLERVRAALLAAGWHRSRPAAARTTVVELASEKELQEFAVRHLDGFVAADAFGEPVMVFSAEHDGAHPVLNHELAHVITNEFLVSKPRWVSEGIACYLETLRFDGRRRKVFMGDASPVRRAWLKDHPVLDYTWVMQTGVEAEIMDADAQYAFETGAWLLVHWLVDTRAEAFDAFLNRLARGDEWQQAFGAAFPGLGEAAIRRGMKAYLEDAKVRIDEAPAPRWDGAIALRRMDPGEVHALRADLLRLSPGYGKSPERDALVKAELAMALAADPGSPLALQLTPGADPRPAVAAHPGDWRTWILVADRGRDDPAAIEKAARLAPSNPGVLERLAFAELARGERDRALEHAVRAADLAPARPDALDTLAQVYGALNRCAEARAAEQRAIDSLPDAALASAPRLRKRLDAIDRHCGEEGLQRGILVQPVQKGCSRKLPPAAPKDHVAGAIIGEFTIHEDGSVADVTVTGDASDSFIAAMKVYFESCSYEPVVEEGRPLIVKSTVLIKFGARAR